jgi:hypothetical protein
MTRLGLRLGTQLQLEFDVNHPCNRSPLGSATCCREASNEPLASPLCVQQVPMYVTSRVVSGQGALVPGTLLAGYFFQHPNPELPRSVLQRWYEATLPDGSKHPVCLQAGQERFDHPTCPGAEAMCSSSYASVYGENWE